MSESHQYFAFISYSRKDSKVAAWLQRRLEWFRFPVKLVPEDRRPPHGRYVRPIYRDKTNLEVTDEHYWTNIRRALEESRYLIVLCSPNSAISEPVNMEVEHFLKVHRGDTSRVVPVIIGGSVVSTGGNAALCPALQELGDDVISRNLPTMMSDADIAERDAWESGFVALCSYLLQLERKAIGDHIQRETRRQANVLKRWLALTSLLVIATASAAWFAIEKRNDAIAAATFAQEKEQEAKVAATLAKEKEEEATAAATFAQEKEKEATAAKSESQNLNHRASISANTQSRAAFVDGDVRTGFAYLGESLRYNPANPKSLGDSVFNLLTQGSPNPLPMLKPLQHMGAVMRAVFSPNGRLVATASDDGMVRVWNVSNGELAFPPFEHGGKVVHLAFNTDGTYLASASWDHNARVFDLKKGVQVGKNMEHRDNVAYCEFSRDGLRLLTGSMDRTVALWDPTSGEKLGQLNLPGQPISVSFNSEGTQIVTACFHLDEAYIWDATTFLQIGKPVKCSYPITSVAFSPDGSKFVSGCFDGTSIVWDSRSRKQLVGLGKLNPNPVEHVEFSPNGNLLLTVSGFHSQVWDASNGDTIGSTMNHSGEILRAHFSMDGLRVVTASLDSTAQVWGALSGMPIGSPFQSSREIIDAAFSPDGTRVVTASLNGHACVWSASDARPHPLVLRHDDIVADVDFRPGRNQLVTASQDGQLILWDLESGNGKPIVKNGEPFFSAQFSPDGEYMCYKGTRGEDGMLEFSKLLTVPPLPGAPTTTKSVPIAALLERPQFSPDSEQIVRPISGKAAVVYKFENVGEKLFELAHDDSVYDAAFSPDGTLILTGGADKLAKIWFRHNGAPFRDGFLHESSIETARFAPDSKTFVTGCSDGSAKLWDVLSATQVGATMKHLSAVRYAAFNSSGSRLLTVPNDSFACLWESPSGKPINEKLTHREVVTSGRFSPDGTIVVTTSSDKTIKLWDAISGQPLGVLFGHADVVNNAVFSHDQTLIATAGCDHEAHVRVIDHALRPDIVQDLLAAWSGIELSPEGNLRSVDMDRRFELREKILRILYETRDLDSAQFASWLFAKPISRTIYPGVSFTLRKCMSREIDWCIDLQYRRMLQFRPSFFGAPNIGRLLLSPTSDPAHPGRDKLEILWSVYCRDPGHPLIHLAMGLALPDYDKGADRLIDYSLNRIEFADDEQANQQPGAFKAKAAAMLVMNDKVALGESVYHGLLSESDSMRRTWGSKYWLSGLNSKDWPSSFVQTLLELSEKM